MICFFSGNVIHPKSLRYNELKVPPLFQIVVISLLVVKNFFLPKMYYNKIHKFHVTQ